MGKIYFISDVHLGAHSQETEKTKKQRLLTFLNFVHKKADFLYIVGDLFDFWFEYRRAIPKVSLQVLSKMCQLVEGGTEIRYFAGNHDLWLGDYLEKETGVKIYHEPLAVYHNNLYLYIAHGDGLAKGDWSIRILRRIFKNRVNIFLYSLIHPDVGITLAKFISKKSMQKGENTHDADYHGFAMAKLNQGFDAVILGHTHKPLFEKINSKYYINLGEWMSKFTFLELADTKFELKTWSAE
ncbi:MAG: UDP-2,3-diacylglucosamine diphosphatase [bacterium]